MRRFPSILPALALFAMSGAAHAQSVCRDPAICTAFLPTHGDYELAVDPRDEKLLLLTNTGTSCTTWPPANPAAVWPAAAVGDVILRRLNTDGDSVLDQVDLGEYAGCPSVNGPEFGLPYDPSTRDILRVVWRDVDGMKLRVRPHAAATWDAFDPEQSLGPASAYNSSNIVAYSTDVVYGAFAADPAVIGTCEADLLTGILGSCFGSFTYSPVHTEVAAEIEAAGPFEVFAQLAHPTRLGVTAVTGCTLGGTCGMAFAESDLANGGVLTLTAEWSLPDVRVWQETLRAAAFPDPLLAPEDRDVVWFAVDEGVGGAAGDIHVAIESAGVVSEAAFSPITPPASGPIEHVAVAVGEDELVMYYQVRSGANQGNYRLIVDKVNGAYNLQSAPAQFSDCTHAVEVIHSSTAGWLSYEDSLSPLGARNIYRCEQPW